MPRLWTVLPGEGPIVIVLLLTGAVGMPPHSACVWPKIPHPCLVNRWT